MQVRSGRCLRPPFCLKMKAHRPEGRRKVGSDSDTSGGNVRSGCHILSNQKLTVALAQLDQKEHMKAQYFRKCPCTYTTSHAVPESFRIPGGASRVRSKNLRGQANNPLRKVESSEKRHCGADQVAGTLCFYCAGLFDVAYAKEDAKATMALQSPYTDCWALTRTTATNSLWLLREIETLAFEAHQ